jgi:outer membrane protein TolC
MQILRFRHGIRPGNSTRVTKSAFLHPSDVHRLITLATLVVAAVAPVPAFAQNLLTLDQAVTEALSQNRGLRAARSTVAETSFGVQEAGSGYFPRFSVAESWQRGDQPVYVFSSLLSSRQFAASNFAIDALNHPAPIGFFRTTFGVEQLVFDGGRVRSSKAVASLQRDLASYQADQASADLALSVAEAYGRVLVAQASGRAAAAGIEHAREDLARVERRRDVGMATDADVLSLRVHLADLQQREIQATGDAAVARAELNRLMGAPVDRTYDVVEPTAAAATSPALDTTALVTEALTARPSLKGAAAAAELADKARGTSKSGLWPQVGVQGAVDLSGTSAGNRTSAWLVGGELRWSFSTGGAEVARVRAAAEAASRARLEQEDARAAVEVEVLSAIRRLETARARQAVGRLAVEQARESQRIIRDRFDADLAGADEVLRASASVLDAEARRTAALVDELVGQAMLNRALGRSR